MLIIVPLGISNCILPIRGHRLRAQERGVVNILQGLRAVALAPGIERESSSDQASYLPIIIFIAIRLLRRSGHPISECGADMCYMHPVSKVPASSCL